MLAETSPHKCGECEHFRIKRVETGEPFGKKTLPSGEEVDQGVCSVNKGLSFGVLNETTPCRQPPGIFTPKQIQERPQLVK